MNQNDFSLLSLQADDLDLLIGDELLKDEFGAKPASDSEKRLAANRWFTNNLATFRTGVCTSHLVCNHILGKEKLERDELFGTLIDVLAQLGGFPVPIAAIAAKLFHFGLDQLCPNSILIA